MLPQVNILNTSKWLTASYRILSYTKNKPRIGTIVSSINIYKLAQQLAIQGHRNFVVVLFTMQVATKYPTLLPLS